MQFKILTRRQSLALLAKGAAVLGPAALLGGCANGTGAGLGNTSALPDGTGRVANTTARPEPVKVALLIPSGGGIQIDLIAKSLKQAGELALFERDVPGFQLVAKDDKGTPEGAAQAARDALADGAELILGPLFGAAVAAVAPIARAAQVPVIAFSNDASKGGQGVHLLSFFSAAEATRAIEFATRQGRRHYAALIPDNALGSDTEPAFRQAVAHGGGRIAMVAKYPADLTGMMEPSQRVMDAIRGSLDSEHPIDALFLPSASENVAKLTAMLRHHKLDTGRVKLIVTSGWDNPSVLREKVVHGAWLAASDPAGWREFSGRFAKTYQSMPPRIASLAYDAVSIASAFATQPKGQRYTAQNLTRASGFAGVDGMFRLTAAGPIERSLAVLEIQPQGVVVVEGARGFTATGTTLQPAPVLSQAGPVRG